jgi:hypothetical protein
MSASSRVERRGIAGLALVAVTAGAGPLETAGQVTPRRRTPCAGGRFVVVDRSAPLLRAGWRLLPTPS